MSSEPIVQYHIFMKDKLGGQVFICATHDKAMAERVLLTTLGAGQIAWLRRADTEDNVKWAQ